MSTQTVNSRLSTLTEAQLNVKWFSLLDKLSLAEMSNSPVNGYRVQLRELEAEFERRGVEPQVLEGSDIEF